MRGPLRLPQIAGVLTRVGSWASCGTRRTQRTGVCAQLCAPAGTLRQTRGREQGLGRRAIRSAPCQLRHTRLRTPLPDAPTSSCSEELRIRGRRAHASAHWRCPPRRGRVSGIAMTGTSRAQTFAGVVTASERDRRRSLEPAQRFADCEESPTRPSVRVDPARSRRVRCPCHRRRCLFPSHRRSSSSTASSELAKPQVVQRQQVAVAPTGRWTLMRLATRGRAYPTTHRAAGKRLPHHVQKSHVETTGAPSLASAVRKFLGAAMSSPTGHRCAVLGVASTPLTAECADAVAESFFCHCESRRTAGETAPRVLFVGARCGGALPAC